MLDGVRQRAEPWETNAPAIARPVGPGEETFLGYHSCMAHTYCCALFHCVFSTKERRGIITAEIQPRLWVYIGGVARKREMKALGVGGTD